MLGASLGYFRRGEHGERAFLTGAICSFLLAICLELRVLPYVAVAVVPALLLVGYLDRILTTSADGSTDPPPISFSRSSLRALLGEGLRAAAIAGLFFLVPTILLGITVRGALSAGGTGSIASGMAPQLAAGSMIALFTALAFAYLAPVAVVAAHRSLREAVRPTTLVPVGVHAAYFYAWTTAFALTGVGLAIAIGVADVPLVGPALGVFVAFYTVATACHLLGRGCALASSRGGHPV